MGNWNTSMSIQETDTAFLIALVIIGVLLIVGIPLILFLRSDSCLCKQFFAKPDVN